MINNFFSPRGAECLYGALAWPLSEATVRVANHVIGAWRGGRGTHDNFRGPQSLSAWLLPFLWCRGLKGGVLLSNKPVLWWRDSNVVREQWLAQCDAR